MTIKTDIARTLFSVVGALVFSTTFVVAAVGPAKAAAPVTVVTTQHAAF